MSIYSLPEVALPRLVGPKVSLRSRMLFILFLAAVPGMVVAIFLTVQQLREETRQIQKTVTRLANIGAARHQGVIANARVLLKAVVQTQRLSTIKDVDCRTYVDGWSDNFRYFTSLTLFDTDGKIICTNTNGQLPYSVADQGWFAEVRVKNEFVLSDYQVGSNQTPLLIAALPVDGRDGNRIGVIALGISLNWLNFLAATVDLPPEATITVLGPKGSILSHHDGQSSNPGGRETRPSSMARIQILDTRTGTLRADDAEGITRVYGFAPTELGNVIVLIGLPQFIEYVEWSSALLKTLVSPITVLLLALAAAAWASETLVVRHVRSLISTAEEIAAGNMHVRSDVDYDEHELGQLAEALDIMAEEIEQQQSELKQRNENSQVIAQEMQHRIANTLTLARIIATQSLRHSRSRQEFIETYGKRLQALAVSNQNLLQGNWTSASLETVLCETIKLHLSAPEDQVVLQGPEIQLAPRAVLAITMSVHELCTNSLKYGALSLPRGRVNLNWTLVERNKEPWLSITWRETGGPAISSPTVEGYGSRLLKSMIEGNLQGTTKRVFAGEGFKCVLSFPVPRTN